MKEKHLACSFGFDNFTSLKGVPDAVDFACRISSRPSPHVINCPLPLHNVNWSRKNTAIIFKKGLKSKSMFFTLFPLNTSRHEARIRVFCLNRPDLRCISFDIKCNVCIRESKEHIMSKVWLAASSAIMNAFLCQRPNCNSFQMTFTQKQIHHSHDWITGSVTILSNVLLWISQTGFFYLWFNSVFVVRGSKSTFYIQFSLTVQSSSFRAGYWKHWIL